jgi:hypothetical protein
MVENVATSIAVFKKVKNIILNVLKIQIIYAPTCYVDTYS